MSGDRAPRLIVVMGVAGCGKTTLGRALAGALDAPFIEGDAHHPASNIRKMAAAVPLTDDDRWPWLDEIGAALAAAASKRHGDRRLLGPAPGLPGAAGHGRRPAGRLRLPCAGSTGRGWPRPPAGRSASSAWPATAP